MSSNSNIEPGSIWIAKRGYEYSGRNPARVGSKSPEHSSSNYFSAVNSAHNHMDDRHNRHDFESPDETSPLLGQYDILSDGPVQACTKYLPNVEAGHSGEDPKRPEELSNRQLFVILGSVYIGVFLGALGQLVKDLTMARLSHDHMSLIPYGSNRLNHHGHPYGSNLDDFSISTTTLVACVFLFDRHGSRCSFKRSFNGSLLSKKGTTRFQLTFRVGKPDMRIGHNRRDDDNRKNRRRSR